MNTTHAKLARFYRDGGNWSQIYFDVSGAVDDPQRMEALRRRKLQEGLQSAGAPAEDIEAIDSVIIEDPGVPSPVCRFILARNGAIELSHVLPGAPVAPDQSGYGPVPNLVPLLTHCPDTFNYLVVEAGRDGGEIELYSTDDAAPVSVMTYEGRTDVIHKPQAGGWAHDKYQRHSEETWRQNTGKLAETVDDLVREHRPRVVILAGDVRASTLLEEHLASASRKVLSTVATYTRPGGASDDALKEHLTRQLERVVEKSRLGALDHLANQRGRHGVTGVGSVVHALQQAQVDTLLLDPERLGDHELLALAAEPWIAAAPEEALGAEVLARVPAQVAMVRSALLTDATVMFVKPGELPDHADVAATLRWPVGPGTPGT